MVIPPYEVGSPEKNPIFLEKRVYQGSSGVVYPYPVIESIAYIVQANELLRSKQSDLTLMESKLIRLAVSQIMKGDKDLRTYKVNVSQLAEFLEVPKTCLLYTSRCV